jgi:hypothetical protein
MARWGEQRYSSFVAALLFCFVRVKAPDGSPSDMVNRTRAREAARSILLGILRPGLTPSEAPPVRLRHSDCVTLRRS